MALGELIPFDTSGREVQFQSQLRELLFLRIRNNWPVSAASNVQQIGLLTRVLSIMFGGVCYSLLEPLSYSDDDLFFLGC